MDVFSAYFFNRQVYGSTVNQHNRLFNSRLGGRPSVTRRSTMPLRLLLHAALPPAGSSPCLLKPDADFGPRTLFYPLQVCWDLGGSTETKYTAVVRVKKKPANQGDRVLPWLGP